MGFLDRLFGGRAKTAEETRFPGEKMVVKAPMDGIVLPLEQLPDETFAAAILGPGCGIEPTGSTTPSPCGAAASPRWSGKDSPSKPERPC